MLVPQEYNLPFESLAQTWFSLTETDEILKSNKDQLGVGLTEENYWFPRPKIPVHLWSCPHEYRVPSLDSNYATDDVAEISTIVILFKEFSIKGVKFFIQNCSFCSSLFKFDLNDSLIKYFWNFPQTKTFPEWVMIKAESCVIRMSLAYIENCSEFIQL